LKINSQLNPQAVKTSPVKPFEEIAEGMETNFTSYMLAEMRKTIPKETPDSSAMDYYNSLLDQERAEAMAKSESGLGIKKVILDQIVPQHMKHYLQKKPAYVEQNVQPEMLKENKL